MQEQNQSEKPETFYQSGMPIVRVKTFYSIRFFLIALHSSSIVILLLNLYQSSDNEFCSKLALATPRATFNTDLASVRKFLSKILPLSLNQNISNHEKLLKFR